MHLFGIIAIIKVFFFSIFAVLLFKIVTYTDIFTVK